jgi:hypothetical protein
MQDKLQLVFKGSDKDKKNSQIEQITKKIEKIQKLEKDKLKLIDRIKLIQEIYEVNFKEVKPKINDTYLNYFSVLIEKHSQKSFAKWEREIIENMINGAFEYLHDVNFMTDDISKIYSEFTAKLMNNMSKSEKSY